MLREQKDIAIGKMRDNLVRAAGVLFVDFTGLTVEESNNLRGVYRAADVDFQVFKNTLMTRALNDAGTGDAAECLKGSPTGVVLGYDDPVSAAKVTFEFLETCEHIKIKGGVLDGKAINAAEAESLSKMPSREELQGEVVSLAMSPGRNIAGQLCSPSGNIVGAIDALVEKLEEPAA